MEKERRKEAELAAPAKGGGMADVCKGLIRGENAWHRENEDHLEIGQVSAVACFLAVVLMVEFLAEWSS